MRVPYEHRQLPRCHSETQVTVSEPEVLWSILIPTLASREAKFLELLGVLLPQVESSAAEIEVVALHNDGEWSLPEIRQQLLETSRGRYLSYIDDDDLVPGYFVDEVVKALQEEPDCVGFQLRKCWVPRDSPDSITDQSIRHRYNHSYVTNDWCLMNPIKASIAKQATFRVWNDNVYEDREFKLQLVDKLVNETYVPKVMYLYRFDQRDSVQAIMPPHTHTPPPEVPSPKFRYHEWSFL
jgi:hypothetical protein